MPVSGSYDLQGNKRAIALVGNTDASGNVTFNIAPAGFAVPPAVTLGIGPTAVTGIVEITITAKTATSVTVNVKRSVAVTILTISVLAATINAPAGVPVNLIAYEI